MGETRLQEKNGAGPSLEKKTETGGETQAKGPTRVREWRCAWRYGRKGPGQKIIKTGVGGYGWEGGRGTSTSEWGEGGKGRKKIEMTTRTDGRLGQWIFGTQALQAHPKLKTPQRLDKYFLNWPVT